MPWCKWRPRQPTRARTTCSLLLSARRCNFYKLCEHAFRCYNSGVLPGIIEQNKDDTYAHMCADKKGVRSLHCARMAWMIFVLSGISAHHTRKAITLCKEPACRPTIALAQ